MFWKLSSAFLGRLLSLGLLRGLLLLRLPVRGLGLQFDPADLLRGVAEDKGADLTALEREYLGKLLAHLRLELVGHQVIEQLLVADPLDRLERVIGGIVVELPEDDRGGVAPGDEQRLDPHDPAVRGLAGERYVDAVAPPAHEALDGAGDHGVGDDGCRALAVLYPGDLEGDDDVLALDILGEIHQVVHDALAEHLFGGVAQRLTESHLVEHLRGDNLAPRFLALLELLLLDCHVLRGRGLIYKGYHQDFFGRKSRKCLCGNNFTIIK